MPELSMGEVIVGEVIVIDESPEDLKNLKKILTNDGYDINFFDNSDDALATDRLSIDALTKHLVLISLDLKKEDPLSVYEKIKPHFADSKFAFISENFEAEKIEILLSRGIQAFFTKPLSYDDFMSWAEEEAPQHSPEASLEDRADF